MPRSMSFADVLEGTKWPALQPIFQDNSIDQQQRDSFITSLSRMPTKIRHALEVLPPPHPRIFKINGDFDLVVLLLMPGRCYICLNRLLTGMVMDKWISQS